MVWKAEAIEKRENLMLSQYWKEEQLKKGIYDMVVQITIMLAIN
jgi:hypothetical protein